MRKLPRIRGSKYHPAALLQRSRTGAPQRRSRCSELARRGGRMAPREQRRRATRTSREQALVASPRTSTRAGAVAYEAARGAGEEREEGRRRAAPSPDDKHAYAQHGYG